MVKHEKSAILTNPKTDCPNDILEQQVALNVTFYGFDQKLHHGVIEVNKQVAHDVAAFFEVALAMKFPLQEVTPASNEKYLWDDNKLMSSNASSGFNYRTIADTTTVSLHGLGLAFDINPRLNPYVRYRDNEEVFTLPEGATWNTKVPGTLYVDHPLVQFMLQRGWEWGGNWTAESGRTDYQHFQKSP